MRTPFIPRVFFDFFVQRLRVRLYTEYRIGDSYGLALFRNSKGRLYWPVQNSDKCFVQIEIADQKYGALTVQAHSETRRKFTSSYTQTVYSRTHSVNAPVVDWYKGS